MPLRSDAQPRYTPAQQVYSNTIRRPGVYNDATYQVQFLRDLRSAQARILICSPYIRDRRIKDLKDDLLDLTKRNVRICVLTEQPHRWSERGAGVLEEYKEISMNSLEASVERLLSYGLHVTMRPKVHQKIAVVDQSVLWDGSLNFLSHFDTLERLNRFDDSDVVRQAIELHDLRCDMCAEIRPKDDDVVVIGRAIQQARLHRGLTQEAVAQAAGVSRWTVARAESGQLHLAIGDVVRLCRVLGVRVRPAQDWQADAVDCLIFGR